MNLLTVKNGSPKLTHGVDGFFPSVLYLAPHAVAGVVTCSHASVACAAGCLYYTGRAEGATSVAATIHAARERRTRWLWESPTAFAAALVADIERHESAAVAQGLQPTVRLNGTSDLPWYRIPVERGGRWYASVYAAFPGVRFYEYTKNPAALAALAALPNVAGVFSLSESNDLAAAAALAAGYGVAVVIRGGYAALPVGPDGIRRWSGYQAVDGDATDLRFTDRDALAAAGGDGTGGYVVALRVKGRANRRSDSQFFRDATDVLHPERVATYAAIPAGARGVGPVISVMQAAREVHAAQKVAAILAG